MEILAVMSMGAAALVTSWVGYQSTRWSTLELDNMARSNALRIENNRSAAEAMQLTAVDIGIFTNWVNAYASGNQVLAYPLILAALMCAVSLAFIFRLPVML